MIRGVKLRTNAISLNSESNSERNGKTMTTLSLPAGQTSKTEKKLQDLKYYIKLAETLQNIGIR